MLKEDVWLSSHNPSYKDHFKLDIYITMTSYTSCESKQHSKPQSKAQWKPAFLNHEVIKYFGKGTIADSDDNENDRGGELGSNEDNGISAKRGEKDQKEEDPGSNRTITSYPVQRNNILQHARLPKFDYTPHNYPKPRPRLQYTRPLPKFDLYSHALDNQTNSAFIEKYTKKRNATCDCGDNMDGVINQASRHCPSWKSAPANQSIVSPKAEHEQNVIVIDETDSDNDDRSLASHQPSDNQNNQYKDEEHYQYSNDGQYDNNGDNDVNHASFVKEEIITVDNCLSPADIVQQKFDHAMQNNLIITVD